MEIRTDFSSHSRPYVFLVLTLCAILERPTIGFDNFNMWFPEIYCVKTRRCECIS